jgi:hypothetical protein
VGFICREGRSGERKEIRMNKWRKEEKNIRE